MLDNIPELLGSRKTREYSIVLVLVLLGATSFGLGRLSATNATTVPITLCTSESAPSTQEATANTANASTIIPSQETSKYVGSKNGTVYHLPWCGGATRIREENKVWFATKEEAEQAGYRPATNCKGL